MKRHEFYRAIGVVDEYFDTLSKEFADRRLDMAEHQSLCDQGQAAVRKVFPEADIMVIPARSAPQDFAGYTIIIESGNAAYEDTLEFDFGSIGIDVV